MKSIGTLVLVLIVGFAIGSFTNAGNMFSFLGGDKVPAQNLTSNTKDILNEITKTAQKQTGAVFDKQYLDAMITMYESSVALSKIGTVAGGHEEIRSIAKTVSKDDLATLNELKKLRKQWFPEDEKTETTPVKPSFIK